MEGTIVIPAVLLLPLCLLAAMPAHAIKKGDMGSFKFSGSGTQYSVGPNQASFSGTLGPVRPGSGPTGTIPPGHTGSQIGNSGWYVGTAPPGSGTGATMHMGHGGDVFTAGTKYPFQAGYQLKPSDLMNAAASILRGPAGVVGMVALPFLADWIDRSLEFRIAPDGQVERKNQSDGNEYRVMNSLPWSSSKAAACQAWADFIRDGNPGSSTVSVNPNKNGFCYVVSKQKQGGGEYRETTFSDSYYSRSASSGPSWLPSSMDDIAQYMDTPEAPSLSGQQASNIVNELLENGADIPLTTPTVTGPSEIKGPVTTTQNSDGTTTTKQTTSNFQTAGNTITNTSNVTITQTCTGNGSCSSTTSTTRNDQAQQPDKPPKDDSANDTPLSDIPKLYERKYPDGIVGIWNKKSQELKKTSIMSFATSMMPTGMSGGSCPSWTLDLNLEKFMDMGTHTVQAPCWVWDVGKAIVIVSALILARGLVFGG